MVIDGGPPCVYYYVQCNVVYLYYYYYFINVTVLSVTLIKYYYVVGCFFSSMGISVTNESHCFSVPHFGEHAAVIEKTRRERHSYMIIL